MFQLLKTTNKTNKQTNKQTNETSFHGIGWKTTGLDGGSDTSLRSKIKRPRGANKKILRGSPQREVVGNQFNQYHLVMYEPDYLWTPKSMRKMKVLGPLILWVISWSSVFWSQFAPHGSWILPFRMFQFDSHHLTNFEWNHTRWPLSPCGAPNWHRDSRGKKLSNQRTHTQFAQKIQIMLEVCSLDLSLCLVKRPICDVSMEWYV